MGSLADIFAAVRLQLDGTGFEAQATALADKSGKNVGDTLSKQLSSKLKSALSGAIGAGLGLAFGAALAGTNELDAATKQLMADTGMTADEAGRAEKAISSMYEHSLLSYSQIGATLSAVINALHLTGEAAYASAAEFLKFEEATGLSSTAVNDVRGVLDAWNLTAADSVTVMDTVIASHQQYGTVVSDDLSLLLKMAPALQDVNMGWQDGVTLLNLFAKAGISVDRIPTALNTALKKVKSPAEFKQALTDIGTMSDRFAAAQKASDLFGARVGPAIAQALGRTHGDLSTFSLDMTEVSGATDKAAAAVESGFGAQAMLILHQFGGAIAEVAQNFGPLLLGVGMLGPSITKMLTTALGGISGLMLTHGAAAGASLVAGEAGAAAAGGPAVAAGVAAQAPEVAAAGTTLGAAIGSAMLIAIPAALIAGGIWLGQQIYSWAQQEADAQKAKYDAAGLTASEQAALAFSKRLANAAGNRYAVYGGTPPANYDEDLRTALAKLSGIAVANIHANTPALDSAAKAFWMTLPDDAESAADKTNRILRTALASLIDTTRASKSAFTSAWADALSGEEEPMQNALDQRAALSDIGIAQKKVADKKLNAWEHDNAVLELKKARDHYTELLVAAAEYGTNEEKATKLGALLTSQAMTDGLASIDPDTRTMWEQVYQTTESELARIQGLINGQNWSTPDVNVPVRGRAPGHQYAEGIDFVPYTQVALVHRGERILTAAQNAAVTSGQAALGSVVNVGGITVNGVGSDVSLSAARRFGQAVRDEIAQALQEQGSRFSEYSGARP